MPQPTIIKIFSALINILICLIGAIIVLYLQDWFGSGDIYALLFWTVPLAVGLAASGQTVLTLFRTKNRLLRLLLMVLTSGLIAFGFVYLVYMLVGPWINAFSMPVFYLWMASTFGQLLYLDLLLPKTAEELKPTKTALGIAAFPFTVMATVIGIYAISFVSSYLTKPEPEAFLIPATFEGKIRIVYGEECGINPSAINGRRELQIPSDGLLIIQPEFEAGIIDHEYYFVDQNGNKTEIMQYENYTDGTKNIPGVQLVGSGSMGGAMPDGSSSSKSPIAIHFIDLYVYNSNSREFSDREYIFREKRIDSMTIALVDDCREWKQ
ncbi:MAG: hypothetical protein AAGF87_07535 [Bacteroidota bacterium]